MTDDDFCQLLEVITTLSETQRDVLIATLQQPDLALTLPKLYQRLEQNFSAHPHCGHCQSEDVLVWFSLTEL